MKIASIISGFAVVVLFASTGYAGIIAVGLPNGKINLYNGDTLFQTLDLRDPDSYNLANATAHALSFDPATGDLYVLSDTHGALKLTHGTWDLATSWIPVASGTPPFGTNSLDISVVSATEVYVYFGRGSATRKVSLWNGTASSQWVSIGSNGSGEGGMLAVENELWVLPRAAGITASASVRQYDRDTKDLTSYPMSEVATGTNSARGITYYDGFLYIGHAPTARVYQYNVADLVVTNVDAEANNLAIGYIDIAAIAGDEAAHNVWSLEVDEFGVLFILDTTAGIVWRGTADSDGGTGESFITGLGSGTTAIAYTVIPEPGSLALLGAGLAGLLLRRRRRQ